MKELNLKPNPNQTKSPQKGLNPIVSLLVAEVLFCSSVLPAPLETEFLMGPAWGSPADLLRPKPAAQRALIETLERAADGGDVIDSVSKKRIGGMGTAVGRAVAVSLSPLALVAMGVLAPVVKLASRDSLLFVQERIGYRGQPIRIWKFTTMTPGENPAILQVTRLGRFIRAVGLDELPQLFSIIRGDMQWFGPRPPQPGEVRQEYIDKVLQYTKPGFFSTTVLIRGIGVAAPGHLVPTMENITADLQDLERWSFGYNTRLAARTGWVAMQGVARGVASLLSQRRHDPGRSEKLRRYLVENEGVQLVEADRPLLSLEQKETKRKTLEASAQKGGIWIPDGLVWGKRLLRENRFRLRDWLLLGHQPLIHDDYSHYLIPDLLNTLVPGEWGVMEYTAVTAELINNAIIHGNPSGEPGRGAALLWEVRGDRLIFKAYDEATGVEDPNSPISLSHDDRKKAWFARRATSKGLGMRHFEDFGYTVSWKRLVDEDGRLFGTEITLTKELKDTARNPLVARDGGEDIGSKELVFLDTLRRLLRERPVVTPIEGEENTHIKAVGAILLRFHQGGWQTFLVKRGDEAPRYPGFWVFPTGIREDNGFQEREKPLQTILRELQEELHLDLTTENVLGRLGKYLTADRAAVVSPILFSVSDQESEKLTLDPRENADGKWIPISLFLEREIRQEGFLPEEEFGPDAPFGPVSVARDFADFLRQAQSELSRIGWRPVGTREEAKVFANQSVYRESLYHGTTEAFKARIQQEGLRILEPRSRRWAGPGLYLHSLAEAGSHYARKRAAELSSAPALVEAYVSIRNPRRFSSRQEAEEEITRMPGGTLEEKKQQFQSALKTRGHDSILVETPGHVEVVAFREDQAMVVDEAIDTPGGSGAKDGGDHPFLKVPIFGDLEESDLMTRLLKELVSLIPERHARLIRGIRFVTEDDVEKNTHPHDMILVLRGADEREAAWALTHQLGHMVQREIPGAMERWEIYGLGKRRLLHRMTFVAAAGLVSGVITMGGLVYLDGRVDWSAYPSALGAAFDSLYFLVPIANVVGTFKWLGRVADDQKELFAETYSGYALNRRTIVARHVVEPLPTELEAMQDIFESPQARDGGDFDRIHPLLDQFSPRITIPFTSP